LIDSAIEITKRGGCAPELREAPTKTANVRTVTLDADTVELFANLRQAREPYGRISRVIGPLKVGRSASSCRLPVIRRCSAERT
jgi:hypothetical protein